VSRAQIHQTTPIRSAVAIFLTFVVNGAMWGTWVSRIPAIQMKFSLSEAALGMLLLGLSAGVLIGLSLASSWIAGFGSRAVTIVSFGVMSLTLPCLPLAPTASLLAPMLFLFGGAISIMDVAMNEQAVFIERLAKRPFMSRFHGAFSIGGLLGSLLGSALASAHVSPVFHFVVATTLCFIGMSTAVCHLLRETEIREKSGPVFRIPHRALWCIGAVAFISSVTEGTMADWSAVYLADVLKTSEGTAALAFASYSIAMAVARLSGDRLKAYLSLVSIVRAGGLIAAGGLVLIVMSHNAMLSLVGFAVVGLGLANIIPIAFTAAGNHPGISSSTGIAAVASIGYAGFLASPPVIGLLAEVTSLRIAFASILILLITLPWIAQSVSANESAE
jgi:MFS family permease